MIRVFVTGMLAGMGLYSEIQKAKLKATLKKAKEEYKYLKVAEEQHRHERARNGEAPIAMHRISDRLT